MHFDELPQPLEDQLTTALSSQDTDLLPPSSPVVEGAHEMDFDGETESPSQETSTTEPVWNKQLSVPILHSFSSWPHCFNT